MNGQFEKKHGLWGTPIYRIWNAMIDRCENSNHTHFKDYGGRGISVCKRWRDSVLLFVQDMGDKPTPKHQLDRINNNGNYEPSNCKWSTPKEQQANRRFKHLVEFNGKKQYLHQWAKELGLNYSTILCRLHAGKSAEQILKQ